MKIGVQAYTVRDYCKTQDDIYVSLKKIKAMGFDMIQISGFGPHDVNTLDGWLKEIGIEVCSAHSPWDRFNDNSELLKMISEYKKLGCTEMGLGSKPDSFPNTHEGWTRFINKINSISKIIKDNGLVFGYHNHAFEFQKFNGICAMDRIIEECPDINIILDVFWVQTGGANPSAYIDKCKDRINLLHLKDFRIVNNNRQYAEIGQGNLDWDDIIPRCQKYGIPYAVIEQDGDFMVDPFDSLAVSREYLVDKGFWK